MAHLAIKYLFIMKNITKEIKNAINQNVLWSLSVFFDFIENLNNEKISISFWEGEENWATLIVDEKPVGFLWRKYPVLLIEDEYIDNIKETLGNYDFLSLIAVSNLNSEVLKLDYHDLKDYLEYGLDYNKFSAMDLWFNTNSI